MVYIDTNTDTANDASSQQEQGQPRYEVALLLVSNDLISKGQNVYDTSDLLLLCTVVYLYSKPYHTWNRPALFAAAVLESPTVVISVHSFCERFMDWTTARKRSATVTSLDVSNVN